MIDWIFRLAVIALAGGVGSMAFGARDEGEPPPAPERANKIRLLIVTGGHDFEREPFFEMFGGHPDIEWKEVPQPDAQAWFAPDKAGEYDVMVWYDMYQNISETAKKDLLALFDAGKPLLALHHSVANYQDWPEAIKIIGAKYPLQPVEGKPKASFNHDLVIPVQIADTNHPITRFMKNFEIVDEVYKNVLFEPDIQPLLTTDHADSDNVIGLTHRYRNSPVVYLQGGHDHQAYEHPSYRRLVVQSIRWLAGRLPDSCQKGFKPLFNGKNLDGWTIMGDPEGYKIKNGILHSDLPYKGAWVRTNKMYGDFILRVEWKVSEGGNSGVFVRTKDKSEGHPWITGSEIQISNEPRDIAHCTGSLYGTVSVDPRPDESPDVWHQFEVHCRGPHYTVFADNIPIVDVDSRMVPALGAKPWIGYVGVQDNHSKEGYIDYRNIQIKELSMVAGDPTPWRLGTQTYTFRLFTLFEAIDKAKALGLSYIEAYPGQALSPEQKDVKFGHDAPLDVLEKVKRKLADAGIALQCYGVVSAKADEAELRKVFEFARLMGIETITAEPALDAFDLLDQLTQEYGINIAIHNHPKRANDPGYIYWNPDEVLKLIKNRNPRIGACADTGHWLRSELDPVQCLKKLEGRIISLHFKDLNKKGDGAHDVVWGTGVADVSAILAELHRQHFKGAFSIEYEHNWENSMPDIAKCVVYFNEVARELGY